MKPDIAEVVANCLALAECARDPRRFTSLFLDRLAVDPLWSPEEIEEIRQQIETGIPLAVASRAPIYT